MTGVVVYEMCHTPWRFNLVAYPSLGRRHQNKPLLRQSSTHRGVILYVPGKPNPLSDAPVFNRCPDRALHVHTQLTPGDPWL